MTILARPRQGPSRLGSRLRAAAMRAGLRAGLRADLRGCGRELALVVAGGLVYYLIRGAVIDRAAEAFARAGDLMDLERRLGIFWEPAMQDWILGSRALIDLSNAVYFWLHMPPIVVLAVWLFWRKRGVYRLTRNAFLGSAVVALVCYAALPVAPPRFFPELGFVDTMALYSEASYQAQEVGVFVNPYAALPSLHFGWALLLGLAMWLARPRGRWAWAFAAGAVLIVGGQGVAIVLTGNHFILDAVAGAGAAALGLAGALVWRRWGRSGTVLGTEQAKELHHADNDIGRHPGP